MPDSTTTNWLPFVEMLALLIVGIGVLVVNKVFLGNSEIETAGAGLVIGAGVYLRALFQSPTK